MPRRSAAEAAATHQMIVERAVAVASTDGLEGVTIGRLATDLSMSKAGVIGHFGTKEALQLAALEDAAARFARDVWGPAEAKPPGIERLQAICRAWSTYLVGPAFPGGCFMTAASFEFDDRPGPVHDRLAELLRLWRGVIRREAAAAAAAGDLPHDTDPGQIAFELAALAAGTAQAHQLYRDPRAAARCRKAMARVLGG